MRKTTQFSQNNSLNSCHFPINPLKRQTASSDLSKKTPVTVRFEIRHCKTQKYIAKCLKSIEFIKKKLTAVDRSYSITEGSLKNSIATSIYSQTDCHIHQCKNFLSM
ncbi:hypothetical protein ACKWTF_012351 [Chironomus riparius]